MDLKNIYRDTIIEHFQNPRNKGLKGFQNVRLRNPSCGDDVTVEVKIKEKVIDEINFSGNGCSICCASASIMTETIKKKTKTEAKAIIKNYYNMIKDKPFNEALLEEAVVFSDIKSFPARIKCAVIAWNALENLLDGSHDKSKN